MLGTATEQDGYGFRIRAVLDEGHLLATDLPFLHESRGAEVFGSNFFQAHLNLTTGRARQLLHIALLHPAHRKDACLCEVMLSQVVDPLLAEEHVRTALPDLLHHLLEHPLLLFQEGLQLLWRGNLDLRIHLGLLDLQCGVNKRDLGVLHRLWHTRVHPLLVDYHAPDELRILGAATHLLLELDVVDVDLLHALFRDHLHRVHGEIGQHIS